MLPKMSAGFDETKYMYFLIKDNELLEKYNEIWEKVSKSIKKEFDRELVFDEKYLKTKIKCYDGKINTNFHNDKMPKEGPQCIFLSVTLVDSAFKMAKSLSSNVFRIMYIAVIYGAT